MNFLRKKKILLSLFVISIIILATISMIAGKNGNSKNSTIELYQGKPAKYVFLFIGDGMALPQINSTEHYLSGSNKNMKQLSFTQFPAQGLTTTYSNNSYITDSAAAGTAIASGYKTDSGVVGMDSSKTKVFKTIAEMAKESGKKVGIISSVSIDHATPACFYAHQPTRGNYYEIAKAMAESNFDYFAGGGAKGNSDSKRKGRKDIYQIAKENGFSVVNNKRDFLKISSSEKKYIAYDKYLDSSYALQYEIDRPDDSISLAEFTKKGIEVLENKEGFFMMVEGGKIDWACHANDAKASIEDTIAFDKSIQVALEFYKKHPNETTIIVTGDHETGGMTIGFSGTGYSTYFNKIKKQDMSYDKFNQIFYNYKENTKNPTLKNFFPEIEKHFGLKIDSKDEMGLSTYEYNKLQDAFKMSLKNPKNRKYGEKENLLYGYYEPLTVTLTHILNQKAGIAWTSYSHTAVPVPTFAIGIGNNSFNGYYDNTDIAKKIKAILGL